jgi:hypothetical protein
MGQARQRSRTQAALLAAHPDCIYCGGVRKATTIDHMPPRIMFRRKLRPRQFEFPSCASCNQGTKSSDQVAALVGRFLPDATTPEEQKELRQILTGLKNNNRLVLEEMNLAPAEEKLIRSRTRAYSVCPGASSTWRERIRKDICTLLAASWRSQCTGRKPNKSFRLRAALPSVSTAMWTQWKGSCQCRFSSSCHQNSGR